MLNSDYIPLCKVQLPFAGRQRYMHSFDLASPVMAPGFEDYLEIVAELCDAAAATIGTAHMTVDEAIIPAGRSQRRPGPHVDGCFMPELMKWGGHPSPAWNHYCNNIPVSRMAVIVAASVEGCRVWRGQFNATPSHDGDLSHISDILGAGEVVPRDFGYLLSPDCVHESMVFDQPTKRTFLRIALPVGVDN